MEQERRFLTEKIEIRAKEDGSESRTIRGYAAVFDRESDKIAAKDNVFVEKISRNAFDNADKSDIVCLFNHDSNYILGRSKNGEGSMKTGVDERGLWYELDLPNTTTGNDLLESLKRGDIQSSSFAFAIERGGDKWEKEERSGESIFVRSINKIAKVFDTSLVVNPAYPDASVALRSLQSLAQEFHKEEDHQDPIPTENLSIAHRQRALELIDKSAI